jgi:hypothetical protein
MKEVRDRHGDLLEENDTVKVHLMRDDEHSYETAIVQACCSDDPDSDVRLVMLADLQILRLHGLDSGACIEKQWDFHGTMMTKTELKHCREALGAARNTGVDGN